GKATDTAAAASESATSIVASEVKSINDSDSYYTAKPVNMSEDNWLTNLAGGRKNAITIRFGQVKDSNMQEAEEYIELDGKGGKVTLVENGGHFEYGGGTLKRVTINFLTGKRLEGKEVVKDYSDGKIKIVLIVDYNEQGIGSPSALFYSQSGSEDKPQNNYYELTTKN
ncbi:MAG: hypothetical protein Q8930_14930, partial [Bacillota bacterium]|nr:hypothetical protein [Bacillota bacterium]